MIPYTGSKCGGILALEQYLSKLPGADFSGGQLKHYFAEGLYGRHLTIPADMYVVGKIHLKGQLNFLMKGTIIVATEDGATILEAPQVISSPPGVKRAAYSVTEVEWVTVSASDKTDLGELEEELIAKSFDDPRLIAKVEELKCLGQQ